MSRKSASPVVTDGVRVAVDIGGTFTDLVSYDAREQVVRFEKSLSTPEALQSAVMTCFEKAQVDISRLEHFIHGSTVAINAVIQKTGARTALVTTEGFTDVYEVGRTNRPDTYNLFFEKTQPLVPGTLRFGVTERMTAAGKAHTPLSEASVRHHLRVLQAAQRIRHVGPTKGGHWEVLDA
jgi:N-methylhydantoinase A